MEGRAEAHVGAESFVNPRLGSGRRRWLSQTITKRWCGPALRALWSLLGLEWRQLIALPSPKSGLRERMLKGNPMMSKPRGRRRFLKKGAALAGLALGASRTTSAQTPDSHSAASDAHSSDSKELAKELIAYGERSQFVTSVRVPVAERMSPDMFGLTFHVLTPLQDSVGIITPSSLHYVATHRGLVRPGHRSERASADDPRHGGSTAGLHDGRAEAPALRVAHSLHRVPRQPCASRGTRPCRKRTG